METVEVMIRIPKEDLKSLQELARRGYVTSRDMMILNGTVLPKGHGRLIDADAVLEDPIGNTYRDIDIAETIIEADKEA